MLTFEWNKHKISQARNNEIKDYLVQKFDNHDQE